MENNNTLYMMGLEYESAAAKVKERLEKKRNQLRELKDSACSREAYVLKGEIAVLYGELKETQTLAQYLKNYYTNKKVITGGIFT